MSFASRSLPPEPDDPPPTRLQERTREREALLGQVRSRVRTLRQARIRERIAGLTRQILTLTIGDAR